MLRKLMLVLILASFGCGGDGTKPRVGGGNTSNKSGSRDMGSISIFPDVAISSDTGPRVTEDTGSPVEDMTTDMLAPPDMTMVDLGVDMTAEEDMAMDCPRSNVADGGACACNQECTSGVCADATTDSDGFCTQGCMTTSDCGGSEACVVDRFGVGVCRTDDTGANCTTGGQPAPGMCNGAYCLQAGSNFALDNFCSVPCGNSGDCKMGHACTPVRCSYNPADGYRCFPTVFAQRAGGAKAQLLNDHPESTKLCVKVGDSNPCGTDTMASDQQACPGMFCDASPVGRCTAECTVTSDCPAGGCVDFDVSDPNLPIRVCDL